MPYRSQAQQGYMHAAADRGDVPRKVVREFDKATTSKQYARLPEHVGEKDAHGGLAGRLARKYAKGGNVHPPASAEEGSEACQHYSHGGVSDRHDEECPGHPMNGGGFMEDDSDEDVDQPEEEFESDMREEVGLSNASDLRGLETRTRFADGGEAEPPGLWDSIKRWHKAKSGSPEAEQATRDVAEAANALLPESLSGRSAVLKKRQQMKELDEQTQGYAEGGIAEESAMHMQGDGWQDDERNAPRSPLAARLAGARVSPSVLSRLLRARGPRFQ